jgi:hypothetical protein
LRALFSFENGDLRKKSVALFAAPELKRSAIIAGCKGVLEVTFFVLGKNFDPKQIFLIRDAAVIE